MDYVDEMIGGVYDAGWSAYYYIDDTIDGVFDAGWSAVSEIDEVIDGIRDAGWNSNSYLDEIVTGLRLSTSGLASYATYIADALSSELSKGADMIATLLKDFGQYSLTTVGDALHDIWALGHKLLQKSLQMRWRLLNSRDQQSTRS